MNNQVDYNRDFNNILRCLHNNNCGIECLREDVHFLTSLIAMFSSLKPSNRRPDAYAEKGDALLLLEHFQFDNSKPNRNGSVQHQTSANTDRELGALLNSQDFAVINETVKKSGAYYVENFKVQFDSHAKKINYYKREIQDVTKRIYDKYLMGFVIEDASPLGSTYFDKHLKCVNLLWSKEFLDRFERTNELDFVIFAMTGDEANRILSFISRNTIPLHRKSQIVVSKIPRFLYENSYCASGNIFIPHNKVN